MAKNIRTRLDKLERKHSAPLAFFLFDDSSEEEIAAAERAAAEGKARVIFRFRNVLRRPHKEESDDISEQS